MALDKSILAQLKRYAGVFRDARERGANESDTVMYLVKFFEDVLGYDSLAGEISKEVAIKDRYCDLCVKLAGAIRLLVEVKAAGNKGLREKDIEQAENYASRSGLRWVLLTNGVEWRLYHVSFNEGEGITHDLAFEVNLVEQVETGPEQLWSSLGLLTKQDIQRDSLQTFWSQKKILAPASLVRILFSMPVLTVVRRELNRNAEARLDLPDVFAGVKEVISKDALLAVGDITLSTRRKRRRRVKKVDEQTGQVTETEVEEEVAEGEEDGVTPPEPEAKPAPAVPAAAPVPPLSAQ
jgi:hypothetical protein